MLPCLLVEATLALACHSTPHRQLSSGGTLDGGGWGWLGLAGHCGQSGRFARTAAGNDDVLRGIMDDAACWVVHVLTRLVLGTCRGVKGWTGEETENAAMMAFVEPGIPAHHTQRALCSSDGCVSFGAGCCMYRSMHACRPASIALAVDQQVCLSVQEPPQPTRTRVRAPPSGVEAWGSSSL